MKIQFLDRLHERGWVDRWAFLTFAFGGMILIPAGKAAGLSAIAVAAVALIVMCLFAAIQDRSGTGRVRSDQAGDNCYYLGLIYTLASLAYTIFTFDPGNGEASIVQGFGIALATTIVGLVLRVFFNQSRTDLVEVEDTTRIELADAAARLKSELSQITVSMNDFVRQIRQSIDEMRTASVEQITRATSIATEAVQQVAEEASNALKAHDAELSASLRKLRNSSDRAAAGFEGQAEILSAVSLTMKEMAEAAAGVRETAATTQPVLSSLRDQVSGVADLQKQMTASGGQLQQTGLLLNTSVGALMERLSEFDRRTGERLEELRMAPLTGVEEAASLLKATVSEVGDELRNLVAGHRDTAASLAEEARRSREIAKGHNDGLEAELARSRENASKVHGALVEMTSQLVTSVQQRPNA